ncbi:hypothetical protein DSO57_1021626 [Entomophthora muscae]|uniref:Uncharacterized protein n=1 Tax=Entomophthora muscae TaxID=34485 RepID=A0ACC2S5H4_9FUNG|nr:hypothetical protein DSO57_1021626 [Entomophthora muscae]
MKFILVLQECLAAMILIHSSMGGRSHIKAMLEVGQTLGERGHSVQYVALDDNLRFAKGHYNIQRVGLGHKGHFVDTQMQLLDSACAGKLGNECRMGVFNVSLEWFRMSYRSEYLPLLEHVKQEKPDVMVCDKFAFACQEIAEVNSIPLAIGIQALDFASHYNSPFLANDIWFGPITIENMSFPRKLYDSLVIPFVVKMCWRKIYEILTKERQLAGSSAQHHPLKAFDYATVIVNSFFGFEVAQPIPPNIRLIGPILSTKAPPLEPMLHTFLSKHSHVMLVGFGSLISLETREINAILRGALQAMEEGNIDGLIWGLGRTQISKFPDTTELSHDFFADERFQFLPWAPQQTILNHPNTTVFLSHAGLESSFEAIHSRTPILTIPFFSDQGRNAAKLQEMGVGLHIDPYNIDVAAALKTLLSRPNLAASLDKSKALTNSHIKRRQEAANHIEDHLELAQACRPRHPHIFGSNQPPCEISHLLCASSRMSLFTANRLDVYLFLFVAGVTALATAVYIARHNLCATKPTAHQKQQ